MQQNVLLAELEAVAWEQIPTQQGTAELIPDWVLQLASTDPAWRFEGMQALWLACGPETPVTAHLIPFLLDLLRDQATQGKSEILHLLASFVPLGNTHVPGYPLLASALTDICLPYLYDRVPEVREGAFTLASRFPEFFIPLNELLQETAVREADSEAQTRMIESYSRFITSAAVEYPEVLQPAAAWISNFTAPRYPSIVQFHAALHAVRWYGTEMPEHVVRILTNAAAKPAAFAKYRSELLYGPIVEQACDGLYRLGTKSALPRFVQLLKMTKDPEDAHTIAGYLLSVAFPNLPRRLRYTALPPDYRVDRPDNSSVKFRSWRATPEQIARKRSKGRLYLVTTPLQLLSAITTEQQLALDAILRCKMLWMLHSNLLEVVGLPPYRAQAAAVLKDM